MAIRLSSPGLTPQRVAPWLLMLLLVDITWPFAGIDMRDAYLPWFEHIRQQGPIKAFSTPFSDYMPPYLYMLALATPFAAPLGSFAAVKLVSYMGLLLLGLAVRRLLAGAGYAHPGQAAILIALVPSLFCNVAILIQCDAYWAAALVLAVAFAMERRMPAMFFWCGIAVSIKLQAAFAAPFFLAVALARGGPYRYWLMAPAGFLLMLLPAWLTGWPAADLLTIYLRQVDYSNRLSLNAPNLWMFVGAVPPAMSRVLSAIGSAAAVIASIGYVVIFRRRLKEGDGFAVLHAACLCALIVPGLLPRMHERYFFLADVLTLALVALRPAKWRVGALVQFGSTAAVAAYVIGLPGLAMLGATAMIAATWLTVRPYLVVDAADVARSVSAFG